MRPPVVVSLASGIAGGLFVAAAVLLLPSDRPQDAGVRESREALLPPDVERRLEALEHRFGELERRFSHRSEPIRTQPFASQRMAGRGPEDRGVDPLWALDQYSLSFAGGGEGAEYYRLIVDATAPSILDDILALIRDRSRLPALRVALIAVVGTPRFKSDPDVIGTLLIVLAPDDADLVLTSALQALRRVGDLDAARRLARSVFSLGDARAELARLALTVIVDLAGPESNRLLATLFASAADDPACAWILRSLRTDDVMAALDVYRLVLGRSQPVRLLAAQLVSSFKGKEFGAFIQDWIARETDPEVLAALGVAEEAQRTVAAWHALKATGPPDTANPMTDSQTAWAAATADGGREWLELTYDPPLHASEVHVYEVLAAGAIVAITASDGQGHSSRVWVGRDPLKRPGVFSITFPTTPFPVRTLRIELDTRLGRGWNEIDAVEIAGPDGRAWAMHAAASSNYGERLHVPEVPGGLANWSAR